MCSLFVLLFHLVINRVIIFFLFIYLSSVLNLDRFFKGAKLCVFVMYFHSKAIDVN